MRIIDPFYRLRAFGIASRDPGSPGRICDLVHKPPLRAKLRTLPDSSITVCSQRRKACSPDVHQIADAPPLGHRFRNLFARRRVFPYSTPAREEKRR
jgi:hypothetical protein